MKLLNAAEAKEKISVVDFLAAEGHLPDPKMSNSRDAFYRSPLPGRNERTASFKVDRRQNLWYDHGIGKGGSIIDLVMLLYGCTYRDALERLTAFLFFHRPAFPAAEQPATAKVEPSSRTTSNPAGEEKKIQVISTGPIHSPALIHYLGQRRIPLELAQGYCREVRYGLYGKEYYAIGFGNDAGGYELRNPYFKGSSSPKGSTFIDQGAQEVAVFEGFFSFLSLLTLDQIQPQPPTNFLVLNSLSLFEKSRQVMEKHASIHLYLDRDNAGMKRTGQSIKDNSQYRDASVLYQDYKDFNHWLIQNIQRIKREIQALNRAKEVAQNRQVTRSKGGGLRP